MDLGDLILGGSAERDTRFVLSTDELEGDAERDFSRILASFRQRVASDVDADDAATHFDLGVAFKEMGLVDAAIRQLQAAVRAGSNLVATLELLGECFVEKGEYDVARDVLRRAAALPGARDEDLTGTLYWLGRCEQASGRPDQASAYYRRVLAHDVGFRDTAQRLERL